MLALPPRRLAREGVPIAAILLFWNLLGAIAEPHEVGGAVRSAGVVMATLYVVVRGAGLSSKAIGPVTGNPRAAVVENARLAVPAGAWFVGAIVVGVFDSHIYVFTWIITAIRGALAGAGLGIVGLYAVTVGFAAFDGDASSEVAQADDRGAGSEDHDVS